jgi:hypothetical protein
MRIESRDATTNKVTVTYTGTVQEEKDERVRDIKHRCKENITTNFPLEKQISANSGHYKQSKAITIRNGVKRRLDYCNVKEAEINRCTTAEEVWNVVVDFESL